MNVQRPSENQHLTNGDISRERVLADIDSEPLLNIQGVTKTFARQGFANWSKRGSQTRALNNVTLSVQRGRVLGIVGESGSGKSTLANIILGLETLDSGSIRFNGTDLSTASRAMHRTFRRGVQAVFQDPHASLNPRFTVGRSVEEPLVIHGMGNAEEREKRVRSVMEEAGLIPADSYLSRFPHELSGGQRQRVAIARAIILEPDLLIADEPVSMLDVSVRAGILKLLRRLVTTRRMAMVFITHDLSIIRYVCDEMAILYRGDLLEHGAVDRVLDEPEHLYTKALLAAVPVPEVDSSSGMKT
jgi:peptide/nickel transport system ATP-binding protein